MLAAKHVVPSRLLSCLLGLLWGLGSCAGPQHQPVASHACSPAVVDVGGNQIWGNQDGTGAVTVAFEAGFGNDSSVWAAITPRIRAAGARTFVYDRAGMGKSIIDTRAPYSIDNDVQILRTLWMSCGIAGPIIMVGHSYGGGIGLVAASQDDSIRGLVLLDAVVPGTYGNGELEKNVAAMRAQYDEIRAQAPELAKVAIPWAEALPATVKRIDEVRVPAHLPIIDIVAEHGQNSAASAQIWRDAHIAFTAHDPAREYLVATGSSHKVMVDRPDLVVEAILKLLDKVKANRIQECLPRSAGRATGCRADRYAGVREPAGRREDAAAQAVPVEAQREHLDRQARAADGGADPGCGSNTVTLRGS